MKEQEKVKKLSPDLVLMDLAMPRMNGLKATRPIEAELSDRRAVISTVNDSVVYRYTAQLVVSNSLMAKFTFATSLLPSIHSFFARIVGENHQV